MLAPSGRLLKEWCLGDIGVSKRMQNIYDSSSAAFWLPDILNLPCPTDAHEEALTQLYSLVKADLQRRPFPPRTYEASPAVREWPHSREIVQFYRRWWCEIHRQSTGDEA